MSATDLPLAEIARLDVSAASGLVAHDDRLYVVADDELTLCVFDHAGRTLERIALFEGSLPEEHRARKSRKPDLEALALVAPSTLLAVPSGSTPQRVRGAQIVLGATPSPVDFAPIYTALRRELPELNIEGATVSGDALVLLHRGNGANSTNARVVLDAGSVRSALASTRSIDASALRAIEPVELGTLEGIPLGFTDASPLPDGRVMFTAAAEAGGSTYEDGEAAGSVLGLLDGRSLRGWVRLATREKIEGLHATWLGDGRVRVHLVTDPDDRARNAVLFEATVTLDQLGG